MKRSIAFLLVAFFVVFFTSCGGKVYEPDLIIGKRSLTSSADKSLFMQHKQGLTFSDGKVLSKQGNMGSLVLPKGFAFLEETNSSIIAADNGGKLLIRSKDKKDDTLIEMGSRVLSAMIEGDVIAVVNVKNEMKLFSLKEKKETFTFSASLVTAIDVRLASPRFYEKLIFFPTLDGKIQIYSIASQKMIRTMSVSTKDKFNNIIFFDILDKKIIAATGTELYVFSKKSKQIGIPVRDIFLSDDEIVVLRKDGRIVVLNIDLEIQHEKAFPFAYFLGGMVKDGYFYVVENEGYILKINKKLSLALVYQIDFDLDLFFASKDTFYFSNGYFKP